MSSEIYDAPPCISPLLEAKGLLAFMERTHASFESMRDLICVDEETEETLAAFARATGDHSILKMIEFRRKTWLEFQLLTRQRKKKLPARPLV
ncbi:MAG TPA: hypothetical protein VLX32_04750 [Candidatus Acidoferrum sp.]|nr:hypothetical protein [Candidatus Acidoferrum sp.]